MDYITDNPLIQAVARFRNSREVNHASTASQATIDDTIDAFAEADWVFVKPKLSGVPAQIVQEACHGIGILAANTATSAMAARDASVGFETLTTRLRGSDPEHVAHDPDADFSESEIDGEKLLTKTLRDLLALLLQVLSSHLQKCCGANHWGRLRLTGFTDQVDDDSRHFFDIFLSPRYEGEPCRWVESKCIFESIHTPESTRMCDAITNSEYQNMFLDFLVDKNHAWCLHRRQMPRKVSISTPTVSLKELLDQGYFSDNFSTESDNYFLTLDKATLSFKLSLSLLQLSDSGWRQVKWSRETIFFLRDPSSGRLLDKSKSYLSWQLTADPAREDPNGGDKTQVDLHLLGFAQLLMEITIGKCLPDEDVTSPSVLRFQLAKYNKKLLVSWQKNLRTAIAACIGRPAREAAADADQLQHFIFRKIVLNLENYMVGCSEPLPESPVSVIQDPFQSEDPPPADATLSVYDGSARSQPENETAAAQALKFFSLMANFCNTHVEGPKSPMKKPLADHQSHKIKIAVLDSGISDRHPSIRGARKSGMIKECRNFFTQNHEAYNDNLGHGTWVSLLLMKVAPQAEIYVAKVTDDARIAKDKLYCIAQAIQWAVQVWKVDIINLSLVLPEMHPEIEKQLAQAIEPEFQNATRKLIFAAAGNEGGNSPQGWPASRDNVMAIHASLGLGSAALFNPSPENEYNFATLGQDIKICHKPSARGEEDRHIHVSGTSFATPVAAGIAANVLEFARHNLSLSPDQKKRLYSVVCMAKIFSKMSVKMGDHAYVQPWTFWQQEQSKEGICKALMKIIEKS